MSLAQYYYAKRLLKEGKITLKRKTKRLIVFKVINGGGNEYEVILKEKANSCTCEFGSLWGKGVKECSHIKAAKLLEGNYGK